MRKLALLIAAAGLLLAALPASAQQTAKVVATCGTASYTAGSTNYQTVDTTGAACGTSTGGSGTSNVNITGINGAAPSLTNPLFIANAEAADQSGTFTNATQTTSVTNTNADGYATALLSINGAYGTASGVFEESDDAGTTWYSVICTRSDGSATETGYTSLTNTNRQWSCPVAGNDSVRVRSTAVASGTVNVRVGISAPPNNSGVVSGTVSTTPTAATTTDASGTVTTGGTFQSAIAAATRLGCIVENPVSATEALFVFPGANGSATTSNSISLAPGASFSCATGTGAAVADNISVTATTTGHVFIAKRQ